MNINYASLFTGIGGFDLAAYWNDFNIVFQCETNKYCNECNTKNFPKSHKYLDIKQFNAKHYYGAIDIISGGFPCQPFSYAGKRNGKDDDRHLWSEMYRIIREVQPPFVICENVPGIISMELDKVLSDLEDCNYTTETFIIPAAGKGAWHRRDRVWVIAYSNMFANSGNTRKLSKKTSQKWLQKRQQVEQSCKSSEIWSITHPLSFGIKESVLFKQSEQFNKNGNQKGNATNTNNTNCKKQRFSKSIQKELYSSRCNNWWKAEPGVDRMVNGLPNRVHRLTALGNAIVPQIADEFFIKIKELIISTYTDYGIYE